MTDSLKKSTTDAGNNTDQSAQTTSKKRNWIIAGLLLLLFLLLGIICNRQKDAPNNSPLPTGTSPKADAKQAPIDAKPIASETQKGNQPTENNAAPATAPVTVENSAPIAMEKQTATQPPESNSAPTKIKDPFAGSMVEVVGGTFQMGSNNGQPTEKPVHSVTLSSFSIGISEVTQAQWKVIMGNNPSTHKNCDACPVDSVSWDDVQVYLKKLNAQTGKNYRLPTEAEWEYAARGGNKSNNYTYSGSNTVGDVAWFEGNSIRKIHPVRQKRSNELGIFDMTGNVWEWCADWYGESYYSVSPSTNPKGTATGSTRVVRGGCYGRWPSICRNTNRDGDYQGRRNGGNGFRVVLSQ